MLSNNKKTLLISTLIFSGISIGGAVSAEQIVTNAEQSTVSAGKDASQAHKFPSADAIPQISSKPQKSNTAQAVNSVAKPQARMAPPPYPMPRSAPYPGQNRFAPMPPPNRAPFGSGGAPGYRGGPNGSVPSGANAFRPGSVPMQAPFGSGPGRAPGYGRSNGPAPYAAGPYGQRPYGSGPYGQPYNSGRYNSSPFGGNNPMDNFGFGPFSKNSNSAPWETWPFGGQDSLWNRREAPFKNQSPADWFQPGDPKEGMAIMWDDMISAPDELGEMPGGWNVPSISVPNPVDLEDQLEKASKEVPDLIRVYN